MKALEIGAFLKNSNSIERCGREMMYLPQQRGTLGRRRGRPGLRRQPSRRICRLSRTERFGRLGIGGRLCCSSTWPSSMLRILGFCLGRPLLIRIGNTGNSRERDRDGGSTGGGGARMRGSGAGRWVGLFVYIVVGFWIWTNDGEVRGLRWIAVRF